MLAKLDHLNKCFNIIQCTVIHLKTKMENYAYEMKVVGSHLSMSSQFNTVVKMLTVILACLSGKISGRSKVVLTFVCCISETITGMRC